MDLCSAIRGQTFPAHPCFPQLAIASDPASMLEVLRRYLTLAPGESFLIEECVPVRFRFCRNGSRCLLQYAVHLQDSKDGNPLSTWVTALIFAESAVAQEKWTELKESAASRTVSNSLFAFEPLTFIPELKMLVCVFPFDRFLPQLPEAMTGPWSELQQPLLTSFGLDRLAIESQTVEPLRYLPEENAVLRYVLNAKNDGSPASSKRFYVKLYRTRHGAKMYELLQQLRRKGRHEEKNFTVVEPLFYSPEHRCLILDEAPGRSLQELLGEGEAAIPALRRVARAMAAFSQTQIQELQPRPAEEQIDFLKRAVELLQWACPQSAMLVSDMVQEISSRLRTLPAVPIHWDLKPDHVFLDRERVIFIDLDDLCLGDPARDPAHLAAEFICGIDRPEISSDFARDAANVLVEEYFAHVPASWREQFQLQTAIALLEAACGLFKRQEVRWSERAAMAIEEARRVLAEGCPPRIR